MKKKRGKEVSGWARKDIYGVYGKSVLLKNLEQIILIKCSLYIERNIYVYM